MEFGEECRFGAKQFTVDLLPYMVILILSSI